MKAMFQTLAHLLIILVAAFTVIGATIALPDSDSTNQAPTAFGQQADATTLAQSGASVTTPERQHPEGMEGGSLLFGLLGLVQNIVIVGVIVTAVVQLQRVPWRRFVGRRVV